MLHKHSKKELIFRKKAVEAAATAATGEEECVDLNQIDSGSPQKR